MSADEQRKICEAIYETISIGIKTFRELKAIFALLASKIGEDMKLDKFEA